MYLIHQTKIESLKSIIKDDYLKSNKLTGKINQGDGVYDEKNRFVYFSTTKKLFDSKLKYEEVVLYFKSDFLYDRTFYIANLHASTPDQIKEWIYGGTKYYKRKYNRYEKDYNKIIKNLYDESIKISKTKYYVFQQIALLNRVKIKDNLVAIVFNSKVDDSLIEYIKKKLPDVEIKIDLKNKW